MSEEYKNYVLNEYSKIKEIKERYTLKAILKEVLDDLGCHSIKDNEVILHFLVSNLENDHLIFQGSDDIFVYDKLGVKSLELHRAEYYKYLSDFFRSKIIFTENATEATLTMKNYVFDDDKKTYTKGQFFKFINKLETSYFSPSKVDLTKVDYIYNKNSKETKVRQLSIFASVEFDNNDQKKLYTYAKITNDTYNSNLRMVEDYKIDRSNTFFKYELQDLDDILPTEDNYNDLEIIRDNGANAIYIRKVDDDKYIDREINVIYDIDEINYFVGNQLIYSNEELRNQYHEKEDKPLSLDGVSDETINKLLTEYPHLKNEVIFNNDKDLFSRLYQYSLIDMYYKVKNSLNEEKNMVKTLKK